MSGRAEGVAEVVERGYEGHSAGGMAPTLKAAGWLPRRPDVPEGYALKHVDDVVEGVYQGCASTTRTRLPRRTAG
jgi:hypothetical protein